jgi:hypothetical protein
LRPRTFQPWSFLGIVAEMLSHLRAPAWHWSITQIANFPYRRLTMVLPILIERFGDVAAEPHFTPQLGNQDSIGEAVLT